jgi:hypothetical protein
MFTKKLFVGIVILNVVLMTVGVGYSTAGDQRTPFIASVASTQPRLNREIVISSLDNLKYRPDIAYNSKHDEYLVVWENVWGGDYHDIYAQRISATGQLLSWFAVYTGSNKKMQPSVAYDPTRDRYLVTWIYDVVGDGSNWDVVGRLIPWDGPDASLTDFIICSWSSSQWHPKVVYALAQDEYLVTWDVDMAGLDIYGVRLNGTGSAIGGGEFVIAGWPADESYPAVAACNLADQYFVTWQSLVNPPTNDYAIYGRYIDGDGTLAGVYVVDDTTAPEKEADVACSQGGQRYLIVWQTMYSDGYYGVWGRVAYPDESMDEQFGLVASGNAADRTFPAVAGGKVSYLTAWEHIRDGTSYQDIHGRLVMLNDLFLPIVKK